MKKLARGLPLVWIIFFWIESAYCTTAVFSQPGVRFFELRVLTGATGGQWDNLGNALAEVLNQKGIFTTCRLGGAISNINKINQGDSDVGFSMSCFLGIGNSEEEDACLETDTDNVDLLANIYPQVFYLLVRKDFADKYHLNSLDDLLTRDIPVRFATLKPGTGSEFILKVLLKNGYNLDYDQLREKGWQVSFNNYLEIADNFANGDLDCFAYAAGVDVPLIASMEQYIDLKLLSISRPVRDLLQKKIGTETYIIEPGKYNATARPVETISDYACLVVRKDLSEDIVYDICKYLWEGRDSLGANVKAFQLSLPRADSIRKVRVHRGAQKFWNELRN